MTRSLCLGYSTCPNDTFLFYALAHGLIPLDDPVPDHLALDIRLADVEELNRAAAAHTLDITKLSFAALGRLREEWGLLRTGAALGRGCGPLIVAKPDFDPDRLSSVPLALPGPGTTAALLTGLYLGCPPEAAPMVFDEIMPAVARGDVLAGVIIHEGRFTYDRYGLTVLVDLGQWWEEETGMPIPLGGIAIRRELGPDLACVMESAIGKSVQWAMDHPDGPSDYIREYAMEMEEEVIRRHIGLYVNEFTRNMGKEGIEAVDLLFRRAEEAGLMTPFSGPLFACPS
ncbi:MAG: 1,4-dihydroxy-6-naphthoate synthase [Desulfobacterales bacterium]|nr:MAG: 1,4-dihydroxy-6-naphthoate synthase [Desulfobacterales bacterium]